MALIKTLSIVCHFINYSKSRGEVDKKFGAVLMLFIIDNVDVLVKKSLVVRAKDLRQYLIKLGTSSPPKA